MSKEDKSSGRQLVVPQAGIVRSFHPSFLHALGSEATHQTFTHIEQKRITSDLFNVQIDDLQIRIVLNFLAFNIEI